MVLMDQKRVCFNMNRIILVRHGETDANTTGCFLGDLDVDLSDNPKTLTVIKQLAAQLQQFNPAIIVSSPAKRAQQTAQIINQSINVKIVTEPDVREISFGSWEGLTSQEVNSIDLEKWRARNVSCNTSPTNGETLKSLADRVEVILNRLCTKYDNQTIIVVTHVYTIKAALDLAMNLPNGYHANRLWLDTSTATIIDWSTNPDKRIVYRVNWCPNIEYGSIKWKK